MDGERELSVADGDVDCVADVDDRADGDCDSPGEGIEGIEPWPDFERDAAEEAADCGRSFRWLAGLGFAYDGV